jgi:hypothetical protein
MMKYHVLIVRRLLRWHSSPADGGVYDLANACTYCGAGAVRKDPLFASASACRAGVAATYKLQVVISKDVFERLSVVGVTCMRPVVDRKKKKPVEFWSLEPEGSLPRWSNASEGFTIEAQCSHCRRDGYFDTPKRSLDLVYATMPAADVLATWEHFGNSRLRAPFEESLFAIPRLIVSDRVRDVLSNSKGVEFCEVQTTEPNHAPAPTPPSVTAPAGQEPRLP